MIRTLLLSCVLCIALCNPLRAQKQTLSPAMQDLYKVCLSLRDAIHTGNLPGLQAANKELKRCNPAPLSYLRCEDTEEMNLNGHFIFYEKFIDSLIKNRKVYQFSQSYAREQSARQATYSEGTVYIFNSGVKRKSRAHYTLNSRGLQEFAFVTEPGGRITLRIHDKTNGTWYNDTKSVRKGLPSRTMIFKLPENTMSLLEIEVINCGDRDTSFVILSN